MRIYIAGPMTGRPYGNRHEFDRVEARLREAGHSPVNPCNMEWNDEMLSDPEGRPRHEKRYYLQYDLPLLLTCDAIVLLPDWHTSEGARLELHAAKVCGLKVGFWDASRDDVVWQSVGPGGAPNRATTLPTDAAARKQFPVATGVLDYFPDAIVSVALVSYVGNQQHNAGAPVHWDRSKSTDEADTLIRHFLERGRRDVDGLRHTAKMAWRALALLQKEIEEDGGGP